MKTANTFLLAVALVLTTIFTSANAQVVDSGCNSCAQVIAAPAPMVIDCGCNQAACSTCQPVAVSSCGCQKSGCLKCLAARAPRLRRGGCNSCQESAGCAQCPKCEGDVCKLELDNSKVKKTCFKTEQKSVCVPPVRFPWQKCCPPGKSKTRLVTKLSKHSYECPNCTYKWSVQKAEAPTAPESAAPVNTEPTPVYDSYIPQTDIPPAPQTQAVPELNTQIVPAETYVPQQQPPAPATGASVRPVQPWNAQGQVKSPVILNQN